MDPCFGSVSLAVPNSSRAINYVVCAALVVDVTIKNILNQLAFRTLTPRKALNLFQLGTWRSVASGECLVQHGEKVDSLSIILSGRAAAEVGGRVVTEIREGSSSEESRRPSVWM